MRCAVSILLIVLISCRHTPNSPDIIQPTDTTHLVQKDSIYPAIPVEDTAMADRIVTFAKAQIGAPYRYGCSAPSTGFDCSGFVSYVFDHFNIPVPRSSVDFTNVGTEIPLEHARPGDVILFTGTNSNIRVVGHIGIILANDTSGIRFIHSSSGKEEAVTITALNDRYKERFVKVIRIVN